MKKRNRILSMLLSAALMISLAACGKDTAQNSASSSGSKDTTASSVSESQGKNDSVSEEASKYPEYLNLDSAYPAVKEDSGEKVKITIATGRNNNTGEVPVEDVFFFRYLADIMNVEIEVMEGLDSQLMWATGDLPDILFGFDPSAEEMVTYGSEEGMLLCLDDYMTEELMPNLCASREKYPDAFFRCILPDGKTYGLPRVADAADEYYTSYGAMSLTMRTYINQKWLDACNLKLPSTLDEYVDMLLTFQEEDPMNLGDQCVASLSNAYLDRNYIWMALGFYGGGMQEPFTFGIKDGEVKMLCYTEEFKKYLSIYKELYDAGAISKDYFTMDSTTAQGLMALQVCGVISEWTLGATQQETYMDWVAAPPLTSDYCTSPVTSQNPKARVNLSCISASTKYPEVCARILDYMYSKEGAALYSYGPVKGSELAEKYGVDGWYIDEEGQITTDSIVSGKYAAMDYYIGENIIGSLLVAGDFTDLNDTLNEMAGYVPTDKEYETKTLTDAITGAVTTYDKTDKNYDTTTAGGWWHYTSTDAWKDNVTSVSLPVLYLNSDKVKAVSDTYTVLSDYVNSQTAKFITGSRSLDEFDAFQQELKNMGIEEYIQTYVDAYSEYLNAYFGQ